MPWEGLHKHLVYHLLAPLVCLCDQVDMRALLLDAFVLRVEGVFDDLPSCQGSLLGHCQALLQVHFLLLLLTERGGPGCE